MNSTEQNFQSWALLRISLASAQSAVSRIHHKIKKYHIVTDILHIPATHLNDPSSSQQRCTFSRSADVICGSSCVNLSNFPKLSSMSLFPVDFMDYFSEQQSVRTDDIQGINSLNRFFLVSFAETARVVSTSNIMSTITFIIVIVSVMLVYISTRRKKRSTRLK